MGNGGPSGEVGEKGSAPEIGGRVGPGKQPSLQGDPGQKHPGVVALSHPGLEQLVGGAVFQLGSGPQRGMAVSAALRDITPKVQGILPEYLYDSNLDFVEEPTVNTECDLESYILIRAQALVVDLDYSPAGAECLIAKAHKIPVIGLSERRTFLPSTRINTDYLIWPRLESVQLIVEALRSQVWPTSR